MGCLKSKPGKRIEHKDTEKKILPYAFVSSVLKQGYFNLITLEGGLSKAPSSVKRLTK